MCYQLDQLDGGFSFATVRPPLTLLPPTQALFGMQGTMTGHTVRRVLWALHRGLLMLLMVVFWSWRHQPHTASGSFWGSWVQMAPLGHWSQYSPGAP